MSASFNQVTLLGNITRDLDIKYTPKGTAVADIGLALNHVYKVGDEKREEVTFVDCTAFGKTAEIVSEYARKGDPILISGRLKQETWEDKQSGQKRGKLKVVVDTVQLLGKKRSDEVREGREAARQKEPQRGQQAPKQDFSDPDLDPVDDDIPF